MAAAQKILAEAEQVATNAKVAVAQAKREIIRQEAAVIVGIARAQEAVDIASKRNRGPTGSEQEKVDGSAQGPTLLKRLRWH